MASRTSPPAATGASPAGGTPRRGLLRRRSGASPAGPRQPGRVKQMVDVYTMTRKVDPSVTWWMLGAFLVPLAVFVVIGVLTTHWLYFPIIGLAFALLAAVFVLARRAERAAYTQLEGQPGAAGAALRVLRRGWIVEEQPVAVDPRTRDTVFRAVGRPGVLLVSDGPPHRVTKLLETERRKVARVLPDVPIHVLQGGREDGQVPVAKLPRTVMRLRPTLTKQEVDAVTKRLKALGGMRPPIPQGIDPTRARPDRRAVRGR